MDSESLPWLASLIHPDPLVFPTIFLISNLLNIQIQSARRLELPTTTLQRVLPWVFRVGIVGMSMFATLVPGVSTHIEDYQVQNILRLSKFNFSVV